MRKRLLTVMLTTTLLLTMASIDVFAEENNEETTIVMQETSQEQEEAVIEAQTVSEDYIVTFENEALKYETAYTGEQISPAVVVKTVDGEIISSDNYQVTYEDNREIGTHLVNVKGLGMYSDLDVNLAIIITSKPISACRISIASVTVKYTGSEITPKVTVKDGEKTLVLDQDYQVSYSANKNIGTATATVSGAGQYTGSKTIRFKIEKNTIQNFTITLAKKAYAYTGKAIKPAVTVAYGKSKISSSNYKLSYKNNKNIGTATVTVTARGNNLTGTKKVTFKIVPPAPKFTSAASSSSGITLKWNKSNKATGYYVYRSEDGETFTRIAKTSSRSYTDKKVVGGKEYTYYILAYKGKYNSAASARKTVVKKLEKPVISSAKDISTAIQVTWGKVSGASYYELYRKTVDEDWILLYKGTALTFKDTVTVVGTTYSYKVVAVAEDTNTSSTVVSAKRGEKTPVTPVTPTDSYNLKVKRDADGAKTFYASWNKYTGATEYEIWWSKDSTFPVSNRHFGNTKNLHFEPQVIYCGAGTWYIKVRAITVNGNKTIYSKWSNVSKFVIQ